MSDGKIIAVITIPAGILLLGIVLYYTTHKNEANVAVDGGVTVPDVRQDPSRATASPQTTPAAPKPVVSALEKLRQRLKELEVENADLRSQAAGTKHLQAEVAELRKKLQERATAANPPVADAAPSNPSGPPVPMTNDIAGFKEFAGRFTKNLKVVFDEENKKDGIKPNPDYIDDPDDLKLVSVDMLKTDSLVHPIVAVADVTWTRGYRKRDKSLFSTTIFRLKLSFAWTKGRWEYVNGKRIVDAVFGEARKSDKKVGDEEQWDPANVPSVVVAVERTNASGK